VINDAAIATTLIAIAPVKRLRPRLAFSRQRLASLAALLLLGGCAEVGDFGRPRASVFSRDDASWSAPRVAAGSDASASVFALTDDEKLLRENASALLAPPAPPYQSRFAFADPARRSASDGEKGLPDPTEYGTNLLETPYRSATARYSRLIEDIRNDTSRIGPFASIARQVADIDRKREKSLTYVSGLTASERANAALRMRENASVVVDVKCALSGRAASYRYALERLVIATPSPVAAEAERALNELKAQIASLSAQPSATLPPRAARAS
jgi:hypothetical protein